MACYPTNVYFINGCFKYVPLSLFILRTANSGNTYLFYLPDYILFIIDDYEEEEEYY